MDAKTPARMYMYILLYDETQYPCSHPTLLTLTILSPILKLTEN